MSNAEDLEMVEKRKLPRTRVQEALDVIDVHAERSLGRIVDISVEGMMLLSPEEIPVQAIYQLQIPLPPELEVCGRVSLGVESLWSRQSNDGTQYWTGFHVIDISDEDRDCIERLVQCF